MNTTLASLPRDTHYKLTAADTEKLIAAMPSYESILAACKGRKGLRTGKPKDCGLTAYVWRMARFHGGADVTMPVMASFDLQNWVDEQMGFRSVSVSGTINDAARAFLAHLDKVAEEIVVATGGNPYATALTWGRALGRI